MPEMIESTELLPQPGEEMLGYRIFEILDEILQDKQKLGLPERWERNYQLGKNKHWLTKSKKVPLVSANLLWSHRTRTVNMLTDNNPTFQLSQQGDPDTSDREIYDKLLHTSEHWWTENEQQNVLEKSVTNGETNGVTVEKVVFNPTLENGIGEVETLVVDPYHFGLYPVKCKDIQKAEAVFHYWPMSIREAKHRWPDMAEHIRADDEVLKELGDQRREIIGGKQSSPKGYFSTFAGVVKNMLNIKGESGSDNQETLICEVWMKDYSEDQEGNPVYPGNIRVITACSGGKVVLSDRPNPSINPELGYDQAIRTYLYDKFPFSFTQSVTDTVNIWSQSDFEQLEGLQIEMDKAISQITLYKDRASRLKIINPLDSGVKNEEFTNAPGIINPSSSLVAQGIRYMDPPKAPIDLANTLDLYKDFFFLVAGTFDLESAQQPGRDVIAYKAIAALIERAHVMLKGKIRNYTKMIRERGRMYLSHVMNWYTEDRWISYEDDGEDITAQIRGTDMIVPAKLAVVSGSTMPVSKIQIREEALELFKQGAIDNQELLKRLEWPDRKSVIKRMMQGPLSSFLEKLTDIGAPDYLVQVFGELANMDEKDFEKALKAGEIPPFQALLQEQEPGADPMADAEYNKEMAEAEKTRAEIDEIAAKIALLQEQANTERVEQEVKLNGIIFDQEQIKIKRAELVAEMDNQRHAQRMDKANFMSGAQERADKKEESKGKQDIERKKVDVAEKAAAQKAESKGTAPYREKGMKSNNQNPGKKSK